jgi:outer membrane protein TolC
VKERKLARFPSLSLTASGGTVSESIYDVVRSDGKVLAIGGGLTQPVFECGRIEGEIESAEARERENTAILRMRLENRVDLHLALGGDFSAGK